MGEDEFGNRYFRTKGGKIDPSLGFERRWVIYPGYRRGLDIPPSWHGWMHHTVDTPPTQENYTPRDWQKPHRPNLTGTPGAYRPPGSTLAQGQRPQRDRRLQRLDAGRRLIRPSAAVFSMLTGRFGAPAQFGAVPWGPRGDVPRTWRARSSSIPF